MIVLFGILFYILGAVLAYILTVTYFYYTNKKYSDKKNKLKFAKEKTIEEFSEIAFFLSWLLVITYLIYALIILLKYISDKLLELILR